MYMCGRAVQGYAKAGYYDIEINIEIRLTNFRNSSL